jgi:hypothetical protein
LLLLVSKANPLRWLRFGGGNGFRKSLFTALGHSRRRRYTVCGGFFYGAVSIVFSHNSHQKDSFFPSPIRMLY